MNKLRSIWLSSLLLGLLALAGCEKSTDLGRLQADASAVANDYRPRIEELQRRSDLLLQRGRLLTATLPGIADAGRVLGEAKNRLEQLKGALDGSAAAIQTAVKTGNPEELEKLRDSLHEKLEEGIVETTGELDAVASWLDRADERTPSAPAPAAPPKDVPTPTDEASAPPTAAPR